MLAELITSAVAGGVVGIAQFQKSNIRDDHKKIQLIAKNCGLVAKDGSEIRIHRKSKNKNNNSTEYVYQMPQGMSSKQFQEKLDHFQDGLNIKKSVLNLTVQDIKEIKLRRDIVDQIKKLMNNKQKLRKEVEISFDGMLKFRVYNEQLTSDYTFKQAMESNYLGWQVPIGIDRSGKLIKHDFEVIPHMALGGATRMGKSNFLNSLIITLLKTHGEDVQFYLVDLKGGIELSDYEDIKQTVKVAYEPEEAKEVLEKAYNSMVQMQKRIRKLNKKKIQQTNIAQRSFVIIDECGELNPDEAITKEEKKLKQECQTFMSKISRLGAGCGFFLVLATQYGTGDVIPRQCKQNSDAKLCFRVRNATASNVVLDEEGAEKLPLIKGRAIYQTDKRHIVQTPLIESDDIQDTIKINIRSRKDDRSEKSITTNAERRRYTPVFEETALS